MSAVLGNNTKGLAGVEPTSTGEHEKFDPLQKGSKDELNTESLDFSSEQEIKLEDIFPEGGKGWLAVVGSMFATFSTIGIINSWVFQSYYQTEVMPTTDPSTIAWIGSVQYSLVFLPSVVSGRLFDIGYLHMPLLASSVLIVVSTLLVAECKQYWHFMLAQGISTGLGCAFTFGPVVPVLLHWFKEKRSTAIGVAATGGSLGAVVFPIAIRRLIPMIGFKWTLRALALMLCVQLGMTNLLLRRRLPPVNTTGGLLNPRVFKSVPYSVYTAACFIGYLGMYTLPTYIDISAIEFGISPDFSFYLVSFAFAGSLVGRVSMGFLSDRLWPLNVLMPCSIAAAGMTLAWPHCHTKGSLIAVSVLYGVASGGFGALMPAPLTSMGQTADIGRRSGMLYTFCAISSLCGTPIAGAIYSRSGSYTNVGIYAGIMVVTSALLMLLTKWKLLGGLRGKC